jgi:hypothetical protein
MGIAALTQFTDGPGNIIYASQVNANYATIRDHYNNNAVETSGAQTIAGVKTFSSIPVFSLGATVTTGGITVTAGGLTVTAGGLTVTAGGLTVSAGNTAVQALACTTFDPTGLSTLAAVTATGTATLNGLVQLGHQGANKRYSGGDAGATPAFNWNNGNVQRWRLTANATPTFANPVVGAYYTLELQQDGTGSRTVTWTGATVAWAENTTPTLTTTANRKDVVVLFCVDAASNGTYLGTMYGSNFNNTTA